MKMFRLQGTRYHFLARGGMVEFIQFGAAPEADEIAEVIGGAVSLYKELFHIEEEQLSEEVEIQVREGMSGCQTYYFTRTWPERVPRFGWIERRKRQVLFHLSMFGKLNEGVIVTPWNVPGFLNKDLEEFAGIDYPLNRFVEVKRIKLQTIEIDGKEIQIFPNNRGVSVDGEDIYIGCLWTEAATGLNPETWVDEINQKLQPYGMKLGEVDTGFELTEA